MKYLLALASFVVLCVIKVSAQTTIPAKDAAKHIGKTVTICDKVFSGKLVAPSNMTMLYLGGNYPNQALTVIIKDADKKKFTGRPEVDDRGKDFIVTGKLVNYEGKPGIVVSDPKQFKVVLTDNTHQLKRRF